MKIVNSGKINTINLKKKKERHLEANEDEKTTTQNL